MAFVSLPALANSSMVCAVGAARSSTWRARASRLTSSITGRAPWAPVPTTSRRQCHGMSSAVESGVWPYEAAEVFGGLLLPLTNAPAIDDHVVLIHHTVDLNGTEFERAEVHEILPIASLACWFVRQCHGRALKGGRDGRVRSP